MAAKIIKLGTLYIDDEPQSGCPGNVFDKSITIGDGVRGKKIEWVSVGSRLVARDVLCTDVSWDTLDKQGLIKGKIVTIDDKRYICRSLRVGSSAEDKKNEWGNIVRKVGDSDEVWMSRNLRFWGQDSYSDYPVFRVIRSLNSEYPFTYGFPDTINNQLGFKPVLEPLEDASQLVTLLSEEVDVALPFATIRGTLVSVDDYDICIQTEADIPFDCDYAIAHDGIIVVKRPFVSWVGGLDCPYITASD